MTPADVFVLIAPGLRIVAALALALGGMTWLMRMVEDFGETPTWDGGMATLGFGGLVLLMTVAGVAAILTVQ